MDGAEQTNRVGSSLEKQKTLQSENQEDVKETPEQKLTNQIYMKITELRKKVQENSIKEWEECFMSRGMEKKLDSLFQLLNTTKAKLELDFAHKPYFVDKNPETKLITVNGEPYQDETDDFVRREIAVADAYWRNEWYEMFHDENYNTTATIIYIIIVTSIIVSVITTIAGTIPTLSGYEQTWKNIELVVTLCFSIEYVVKLILVRNRLQYMARIMNILDLLAILPFYLQAFLDAEALESVGGVLRALRLTRIAKIRQLASPYTNIIMHATVDSLMGAGSSVAIFLFIGTVMTGTLVYAFEKDENPDFTSIPMGMWYSIVTMTTVGYGDLYPITWVGQILGVFTILVGLILVSLVVMVVGNYYILRLEEYQEGKRSIKMQIYNFAEKPNIKEYFEKKLDKCIPNLWTLMLKKYPTDTLFSIIWIELRKKEELKKDWWWSRIPTGEVKRTHTFSHDDLHSKHTNVGTGGTSDLASQAVLE